MVLGHGQTGRLIGLGKLVSVRTRKAQNVTAHVCAYVDTASDVPMMELSELPAAAYPKDELPRIAQKQVWRILKGSQ